MSHNRNKGRGSCAATKDDLKQTERRIIKAIGSVVESEIAKQIQVLKTSGDQLQKAVDENQPET